MTINERRKHVGHDWQAAIGNGSLYKEAHADLRVVVDHGLWLLKCRHGENWSIFGGDFNEIKLTFFSSVSILFDNVVIARRRNTA